MKKIIALLLVISIMAVSVNVIFAAEETAEQAEAEYVYSCEEDTVIQLGLMETELSGDFESDREVTRMDMVIALYRALNYQRKDEQPVAVKSYYKDIDSLHYASGYLVALTDLGIVDGYPDGTFRPGNAVTLKDAYVMTLRCLGYFKNEKADDAQIYRIAKKLGLDLGTDKKGTDVLNRGELAIVLYNMLFADYYDVFAINVGGQGVAAKGKFITEIMDLSYENGILREIGGVSLYDRFPHEEQLLVNEKTLKNHLEFGDEYLGYNATVIYDDETLEAAAIIFPKENNVVTIDTGLLESYENKTYRYYKNETATKVTKATLQKTADILYNNYVCFDSTRMTPKYGKVILIDNDADNIFEVAKVYEFKSDLVDNVLENKDSIEIALKKSKRIIKLNDYTKYKICSANGADIKPGSVRINSVATICEADNNVITIYISTDTVEGNVSYIRKGTGERKTVLGMDDDTEYELLTDSYLQGWDGKSTGRLRLCLDINGYVAAVLPAIGGDESSDSGWKYGYIFGSIYRQEAFNDELQIKILSQDNMITYITIKDRVRVDNVQYKNMKAANNAIQTAYDFQNNDKENTVARLIRYYQSEGGRVSKLDTPIEYGLFETELQPADYHEENNCFMLRSRGTMWSKRIGTRWSFKTLYMSDASNTSDETDPVDKKLLGEVNFAADNKPVFVIPITIDHNVKDEDFVVGNAVSIPGISDFLSYYVSGYNTELDGFNSDVMVIRKDTWKTGGYKVAMITNVGEKIDAEGNVKVSITANFDGGSNVAYCVKENSPVAGETLQAGDVVRYYLMPDEVVVTKLLYRYGSDEGALKLSGPTYDGDGTLYNSVSVITKVDRRTDEWLKVQGIKDNGTTDFPLLLPLLPSVQFFDVQSGEFYTGNSNDIRTVDQYGEENADILIYSVNSYNPESAVVIRTAN